MHSTWLIIEHSQRTLEWWKRRTRLEKILTVTTTTVIIIGIALAIANLVILSKKHQQHDPETINLPLMSNYSFSKHNKLCESVECLNTASRILDLIDETVDPCDDFYQFACGNFLKNTHIPANKVSVSSFNTLEDLVKEQLRILVTEPIYENEPKPFKLVKNFYKICMDTTRIEKQGLTTVLSVLKELGGWPVLEGNKWIERDFDWISSAYKFKKIGYSFSYFMEFSIETNPRNTSEKIINLGEPILGMEKEFLVKGFKEKLIQNYYDYMVDIATILGANRERAKQELAESLNFEIKLAQFSLAHEKWRHSRYVQISVRELQGKYPSIPWIQYINTLIDLNNSVTNNTIVMVTNPKYITDLETLIMKTPKRVQANYAMWRVVASSVFYLSENLRRQELKFANLIIGVSQRQPRWKECITVSSKSILITALGAMYIRKHYDQKTNKSITEMVNNIREEFINTLKNIDWMDKTTKMHSLEKATAMSAHIGYHHDLKNISILENIYKNLELDGDNYMRSFLNLSLFNTKLLFDSLKEKLSKSTYPIPTVVDAFYTPTENTIQLPAAILQGVFFNANRPSYMNYGAIGFIIGHEITHGFDDLGRFYDKDGNYINWWSSATIPLFLEKAQCIINQYSNYTIPEVNLNISGIITQGENIADNGGIKVAYRAYNNWVKKNGKEQQLPGLNYTDKQLFWISAANMYCSKTRPEWLKQLLVSNTHPPKNFRINGSFRNSKDFAKDFKCTKNSRMNPIDKCDLW